jgi:O-antigen/teichoic acid export membrane protein
MTHYLNESDLGVIYLYTSLTVLLVPFIGFGTPMVLTVEYFKLDKANYAEYLSAGLLIPLVSALIFASIFAIAPNIILKFNHINYLFVVLLPLNCLMIVFSETVLALVRNRQNSVLFATVIIGRNLIEISLTIFLVVGLSEASWEGRLGSVTITLIIASLAFAYALRRWGYLSPKISKKNIVEIVRTGLPFIPERLAIFVMYNSAGFFINHFQSTGDVGFYSAGAQIASIVNVSTTALIGLFQPYIFKNLMGEPNFSNLRKAVYAFIGISFLISATMAISAPWIFYWFIGPKFQASSIYAFNLIIGYFFWAIYAVFMSFLLFKKKNRLVMLISIAGMALSISLNAAFVYRYGALGATYSSIVVFFCMAMMMGCFAHRSYDLRFLLSTELRKK